jgi:asparagine synthetase B (glutamine-hydrolysing)
MSAIEQVSAGAERLRHALVGAMSAFSDEEVALLLSGGVDSLSLGFAAMRAGKRVSAYTFQVEDQENADVRAARQAAQAFGWNWTLVNCDTSHLERDFLELARTWECRLKTQFECTWPFLQVIPRIRERVVMSGIAADGHYGLSRKALARYRVKESKENFDRFRSDYFAQSNPAGQQQQWSLIGSLGKRQFAPYLYPVVIELMREFDWRQLNRPWQKMLTLLAFREEFGRIGRRDHANLQLVAGVDRVFERLLLTKVNVHRRHRVLDLCRDYSKESSHE